MWSIIANVLEIMFIFMIFLVLVLNFLLPCGEAIKSLRDCHGKDHKKD